MEVLRAERRAAILDAALHVFSEEHYHNASIGQIAKRANISKGLIYNYFDSKEDILVTLMLSLFDELSDEFGITNETEPSRELLVHFIDRSFEVVIRDRAHWKLYFSVIMQQEVMALVMDKMMEKAAPYMNVIGGYFTQIGHPDPVARMRYFSAAIDGVQMHLIMDAEHFPLESVKQMIITEFLPE